MCHPSSRTLHNPYPLPPTGTELFAREEALKEEVDKMWLSLDEEIKSDYGEAGRKRVETFMRNIRNKGVSVSICGFVFHSLSLTLFPFLPLSCPFSLPLSLSHPPVLPQVTSHHHHPPSRFNSARTNHTPRTLLDAQTLTLSPLQQASDISPVITAFTEALTQQHPQTRYDPMDPLMYFTLFLATHFPDWVYDSYFALMVRLSK